MFGKSNYFVHLFRVKLVDSTTQKKIKINQTTLFYDADKQLTTP
jgi:hypothetical protein